MKKLIVASMAIAMASIVNAASFQWSVAGVYTPTAQNLSPSPSGGTQIAAGAASAMLYWSTDGSTWKEAIADPVSFTKAGGFNATVAFDADNLPSGMTLGNNYFKAIVTYTDANEQVFTLDLYKQMNTTAQVEDLSNLGNSTKSVSFMGVTSATTGRTWETTAVPEPTSGLLLLLGVGAMALRRRRA